eukprot:gene17220-19735_t
MFSNFQDVNTSSASLLIVILGLTLFYLFEWKKKGNKEDPSVEYVELLSTEKKMILRSRSPTSITFYNGDITAEFSLAWQVLEILKANPWLAGRVLRHRFKGRWRKEITLIHPKIFDEKTLPLYYEEIIASTHDYQENDQKLPEKVNKFVVGRGLDVIDQPEKILFKVTVLKLYDKESETHLDPSKFKIVKSALIVSLNHVIGDGHTFYTIYSFLDGKQPIQALTVKRVLNFLDIVDARRGDFYKRLSGDLIFFLGLFVAQFSFGPIKQYNFLFNLKEIEEIKKNRKSEKVKFLSTNDIVTAKLFQLFCSPFSVMTINFRNRFNEFTDIH